MAKKKTPWDTTEFEKAYKRLQGEGSARSERYEPHNSAVPFDPELARLIQAPKKARPRKGKHTPAVLDPSESYAPPHIGSSAIGSLPIGTGPIGGGPIGSPPIGTVRLPEILPGGEIDPTSLPTPAPEAKHAPETVRETVIQGPLVVKEGEALRVVGTVTALDTPSSTVLIAKAYEKIGSNPAKEVALFQLRGLIEACDEAVHFDRTRNVRAPYLWADDHHYLAELRDILTELRQLNAYLEKATAGAPAPQDINGTTSRLGKLVDAYTAEIGKDAAQLTKGALVLAAIYLGADAGIVAKLLGK